MTVRTEEELEVLREYMSEIETAVSLCYRKTAADILIDVDWEKGIWLSLRADGCGRVAWEEGEGDPPSTFLEVRRDDGTACFHAE